MCKFWFGVHFPFNLRCSSQKWNRQFLHLSLIVIVLLFILCYECFVSHSSVLSNTKLNAHREALNPKWTTHIQALN